jgi:hypothetical protein
MGDRYREASTLRQQFRHNVGPLLGVRDLTTSLVDLA